MCGYNRGVNMSTHTHRHTHTAAPLWFVPHYINVKSVLSLCLGSKEASESVLHKSPDVRVTRSQLSRLRNTFSTGLNLMPWDYLNVKAAAAQGETHREKMNTRPDRLTDSLRTIVHAKTLPAELHQRTSAVMRLTDTLYVCIHEEDTAETCCRSLIH